APPGSTSRSAPPGDLLLRLACDPWYSLAAALGAVIGPIAAAARRPTPPAPTSVRSPHKGRAEASARSLRHGFAPRLPGNSWSRDGAAAPSRAGAPSKSPLFEHSRRATAVLRMGTTIAGVLAASNR